MQDYESKNFAQKLYFFFFYWNESIFIEKIVYIFVTFILILYLKMTMYYNYFELLKYFCIYVLLLFLNFVRRFMVITKDVNFLEILK